ncbi:MAG: hypothetical protein IBX72_06860 [Nitrospirae bacterium]|jgi:hypothetical protein|nr:hypothetical protein [Nitrospirota bacterium]
MLENKIEGLKEEIRTEEAKINTSKEMIAGQEAHIKELEVFRRRLLKIEGVKYFQNIGNAEEIAALANRFRLRDFLDVLSKIGIIFTSGEEMERILNLTLWQSMYIFFADLTPLEEKTKTSSGAEDPGQASEKTEEANSAFPVDFTKGGLRPL